MTSSSLPLVLLPLIRSRPTLHTFTTGLTPVPPTHPSPALPPYLCWCPLHTHTSHASMNMVAGSALVSSLRILLPFLSVSHPSDARLQHSPICAHHTLPRTRLCRSLRTVITLTGKRTSVDVPHCARFAAHLPRTRRSPHLTLTTIAPTHHHCCRVAPLTRARLPHAAARFHRNAPATLRLRAARTAVPAPPLPPFTFLFFSHLFIAYIHRLPLLAVYG